MNDPFNLARFTSAQSAVYAAVLVELCAGCKRSHWMWFVFPQIDGLGGSPMARRYAIRSLEEAVEYLRHPVLGPRLRECVGLVNAVEGRTAHEIFGAPDDLKFRSSLTLFGRAAADNGEFVTAIAKYYAGQEDERTLELLGAK